MSYFFELCINNTKMSNVFGCLSINRGLRMLSLVLGSEITDASVAAIASSYPDLELLDLSGYVANGKFNSRMSLKIIFLFS